MTRFYVKVDPGSDEVAIDCSGTYPRIALTAPAEQGRANAQLQKVISEALGADVAIVSGHQSPRKEIVVDMAEDEVMATLGAEAKNQS